MPLIDIIICLGITVIVCACLFRIVFLCVKHDDLFLDGATIVITGFIFGVFLVALWQVAINHTT